MPCFCYIHTQSHPHREKNSPQPPTPQNHSSHVRSPEMQGKRSVFLVCRGNRYVPFTLTQNAINLPRWERIFYLLCFQGFRGLFAVS